MDSERRPGESRAEYFARVVRRLPSYRHAHAALANLRRIEGEEAAAAVYEAFREADPLSARAAAWGALYALVNDDAAGRWVLDHDWPDPQ